jgi:hypothetical protein
LKRCFRSFGAVRAHVKKPAETATAGNALFLLSLLQTSTCA